jgi:serine/threonine protein kinase
MVTDEIRASFSTGRVLGVGRHAVVHEAQDMTTGRAVALKVLEFQGWDPVDVLREVNVQRMFDNPYIVKVLDHVIYPDRLLIVLERCSGPDLRTLLETEPRLGEAQVAAYTRMMLTALADIHSKGVCHYDLKPGNVMVHENGNGERIVKVGDFGLACRASGRMMERRGTIGYASPQVASGRGHSKKTDMWSLGVIVCELLAHRAFDGRGSPVLRDIVRGERSWAGPLGGVSEEGWDFLRHLLQMREEDRASASEALAHRWVMAGSSPRGMPRVRWSALRRSGMHEKVSRPGTARGDDFRRKGMVS